MKPRIVQLPIGDDPPTARLYYGQSVIDTLREIPADSVHVCCTSPPYWGLRDYGVPPQQWPEMTFRPMAGVPEMAVPAQTVALGLEPNPMHFIAHMVAVYREVRRVLRPDGLVWINLGDTYTKTKAKISGLPPKNLTLIPHRAALALQADGWRLRSDVVWAKGSCMPEPVKDRCTRSHESVFMLAKSERYFYDAHAVREAQAKGTEARYKAGFKDRYAGMEDVLPDGYRGPSGGQDGYTFNPAGRNRRTVWNINPRPYPGAHFAVWPPELVEPMVKASTSDRGVCGACGAPYTRLVERVVPDDPGRGGDSQGVQAKDKLLRRAHDSHRLLGQKYQDQLEANPPQTVGWEPTCKCESPITRAVVMDIFSGSATTGMVALNLGRDYIGIDLQTEYLELAEARVVGQKAPKPTDDDGGEGGVFDLFGDNHG